MSYLPDLKKLLSRPREFFESISGETGYIKPWLTIVIASVIYYIIIQILSITKTFIVNPSIGALAIIGAIAGFFIVILLAPAAPFIGAGMIYLGALILGVRGTFIKTFKVVCYGGLVGLIYNVVVQLYNLIVHLVSLPFPVIAPENMGVFNPLMLILVGPPILILLAGIIHQFYIEIHGLSLYYNISKLRAFFSIILVPGILLLIFIALIALIIGIGSIATTGMFASDLPMMP